jgi:hypothetical protein
MIRSDNRKIILKFIPISFLLVALAVYFYNSVANYVGAGRDDTFITLWTGISLAEGHGLVNYNLEPVEMSSSLLHTLVIGVIHLFAPDFIYTINKVLGLLAGATLLIVLHQKRYSLFGKDVSGIIALGVTYAGLANSRSWLYWNLGGLETPFQTLILFLYGLSLMEFWNTPARVLPLVVLQTLYLFVRPEGFTLILFTAVLILGRATFHRPFHRKQITLLLGIPSFFLFTILIARYLHFGLLFPNPVYAKVNFALDGNTISTLQTGIKYLIGFYGSSPYITGQAVILVIFLIRSTYTLINKKNRPDFERSTQDFVFMPLLGLILLNHLFVIITGGDWMEFFRFLVPVVPFMVILTTVFAYKVINELIKKNNLSKPYYGTFANVALGVVFLILIATNSGQRDNYESQDFHNCSERLEATKVRAISLDYRQLDENLILMNCAGQRDWNGLMLFITDDLPKTYQLLDQNITIATFQMGFFPYYIKKDHPTMKIRFIDTLGIGDTNVARLEGARQSYGLREGTRIAEILAGESGELSTYVLSKNPNMIYVLNATIRRRQQLADLGWRVQLDKPGAVIFIKDARRKGELSKYFGLK